jgi:uncharacterized protein
MPEETAAEESPRGVLRRADKVMTQEELKAFLAASYCGRAATVGRDGWPYAVPNLFVWMDERVYLHTARQSGHFLANIQFSDRVCFEVDQPGETFPYGAVECDTSIAFRSVVVFGRIDIVSDAETKRRFFAAFMAKYAPQDSWGRAKGSFPRIDSTIVYVIRPEIMTGKQTPLPSASRVWRPSPSSPATQRES